MDTDRQRAFIHTLARLILACGLTTLAGAQTPNQESAPRPSPPMSVQPATSSQGMPSHLAGVETDKTVRLQRLRSGQSLPTEAYDRSGQTKLVTGRLLTMDNQIDPNTGTNRLKAVFENKGNALFPNQFVNIRLLVETRKDKVLIPAVAIQRGPRGTFVYVVRPDQTAEARPVTVGAMEGDDASIESGLTANEQVVVDGVDKLQDVILKDPAVQSLSSFIGVDGVNMTANSGRIQINLKPLEERKASATDVIRRLQPELA